jgi:hypothetical protein
VDVVQRSESVTQVKVMMREVDHFSQEECDGRRFNLIFVSVISSFGSMESDGCIPVKWSTIPVMWGAVPVIWSTGTATISGGV